MKTADRTELKIAASVGPGGSIYYSSWPNPAIREPSLRPEQWPYLADDGSPELPPLESVIEQRIGIPTQNLENRDELLWGVDTREGLILFPRDQSKFASASIVFNKTDSQIVATEYIYGCPSSTLFNAKKNRAVTLTNSAIWGNYSKMGGLYWPHVSANMESPMLPQPGELYRLFSKDPYSYLNRYNAVGMRLTNEQPPIY